MDKACLPAGRGGQKERGLSVNTWSFSPNPVPCHSYQACADAAGCQSSCTDSLRGCASFAPTGPWNRAGHIGAAHRGSRRRPLGAGSSAQAAWKPPSVGIWVGLMSSQLGPGQAMLLFKLGVKHVKPRDRNSGQTAGAKRPVGETTSGWSLKTDPMLHPWSSTTWKDYAFQCPLTRAAIILL